MKTGHVAQFTKKLLKRMASISPGMATCSAWEQGLTLVHLYSST
jgi:hypothetical protein